jgi:hypothetical protein
MYHTEEAWIVGQIAADILEMSAHSAGQPLRRNDPTPPQVVSPGLYRVSSNSVLQRPVDINVQQDLWSPDQFEALARAALGDAPAVGQPSSSSEELHSRLLEPTPATLIATNRTVSQALSANIRDSRAHEAAALLLGVFSLRESAGRFSDVRWALNRMTSHLAMAAALRGLAEPSLDGMLADTVRLVLTNRQTQALQVVEQLRQRTQSRAIDAWTRVIELRVTQDWRQMPAPAKASLLERQEYFRARRETVSASSARLELESVHADESVEWLRIMENSRTSVEDGWLVAENGLAAERIETAVVFEGMTGTELPVDATRELNVRAFGCITVAGPQVLPWNAWAEFFQRHLARLVGHVDYFYRHDLASEKRAEDAKRAFDSELSRLTIFPIATAFRTTGPKGGDADLAYINNAIRLAAGSPELVTAQAWAFLESGANYEAVAHGMPRARDWFVTPSARMPYDAESRAGHVAPPPSVTDMTTLLEAAPHDYALAAAYLKRRYRDAVPYAEIQRVFGPRLEYDLRALAYARQSTDDEKEEERLLKRGCTLYSGECSQLAALFVSAGREREAAAEYERAFADPSIDEVTMSNQSEWLVNYYFDHGQKSAATALANRSSETGSRWGLLTAAHLYERIKRWSDAEVMYQSASTRYDNDTDLIAFYYRAVHTYNQAQFETAWKLSLARAFPNGLLPAPVDGFPSPKHGVVVTDDNERVRKAGLQTGDIIVGLEGWQVDNVRQYRAVNQFFERDEMKLTVWRGKVFQVTLSAKNRVMGIAYRSYPIQGWAE